MAVYNGERYLCDAVESILAQDFSDFEFLIIDDGSTDSTAELLDTYCDPRIRLMSNESNIGLAFSFNGGLKVARGNLGADPNLRK